MQKKHNGIVYLMELIVYLKKKGGSCMLCIVTCLTYLMSLIQVKALRYNSCNIMQICGYYISKYAV